MSEYFSHDTIQTGASLFMKSDSDGSTDRQDATQAIGIRGSLDGTSSGTVGISHFTEFSDSANSIDKNKGLRFDDFQPNSLTFKYNYRVAEKVEVNNLSENKAISIFGRDGSSFNKAYLHKARTEQNEFVDKWDINNINIIDDIAFVSYDKYTDLHRSEASFRAEGRQHGITSIMPDSVSYDFAIAGDRTVSLKGGIVLSTVDLEINPQVFYSANPEKSYTPKETGATLSHEFMCYDNCILEVTIENKKLYFTYCSQPGVISGDFAPTQDNRSGLYNSGYRYTDEPTSSDKYTNIEDLEDGSWGGFFRVIPNKPINALDSNPHTSPNAWERNTETIFNFPGDGVRYFELSLRKFSQLDLDQNTFNGTTWHGEYAADGTAHLFQYADIRVQDAKLIKIQPVRKCGKVDIYVRKRGIITAVAGNRVTSPGHGLDDNNIIKISSALFDGTESGIVDIHPMNGEKFVKRISNDTFDLYEDQYFEKPTTTSKLRATDGIAWACMSSSNNEFGQSWDYYKTMFSPTGKNGYASYGAANMSVAENHQTQLNDFTTDKRVGAVKNHAESDNDDNVSGLQIDFSSLVQTGFQGVTPKRTSRLGDVTIDESQVALINKNTNTVKSILENIPVSNVGSKSFLDITYAAPEDFYPFNPVDDQAISDDHDKFSPYTGCRFGAAMDVKFSGVSGTSKKYTIAIGEPGSDVSVDYFGRAESALGALNFDLTEDRSRTSYMVSSFRPRLIPPSLVHGKVHIIEMTVDQYGKITDLEHQFSKMGNGQTVGKDRGLGMQEFPWEFFMRRDATNGFARTFRAFHIGRTGIGHRGPEFHLLATFKSDLIAHGRAGFKEGRIHDEPNLYWDQAAAAHWFGSNILDYFQQKDITTEKTSNTNTIERTYRVLVAPGTNQFGEGNKFYLDGSLDYDQVTDSFFGYSGISLKRNKRYRFDLSDSSNSGHPFRFSTKANGTHGGGSTIGGNATDEPFDADSGQRYNTYYVGEPGTPGAFAEILIIDNNQPLHYYCANHSGMGGEINKVLALQPSVGFGRASARRNYIETSSGRGENRSRFGEQGSGTGTKAFPRIDRFSDGRSGVSKWYASNSNISIQKEGQWYVCPWVDSFGKSVALHDLNTGTTAQHNFLLLAGCTLLLGGAQSVSHSNYSRQSTQYYKRPILFARSTGGRRYEAQNYDAIPKIGGIRSFRLEPASDTDLLSSSNRLRHSAGATRMNEHIATSADGDTRYTSLGEGESKLHPEYSVGKGVGQVSNSVHLSCSKILVKDNYLFWTEHYLGSSKSVIYMQEIGQDTGTNVATITNSFDAVICDNFNYKTNSIELNSEYATNGFGFDIKYEDGLLATNCLSRINDFGEPVDPHDGIMLYEFDKNMGDFKYVQRLTSSFNSLDDKYSKRLLIDYSRATLDINNITYEGDAHGSRTWNTRLVDRYEIVNGKILLRDPIEFVIFAKDFSIDRFSYEDKHGALAATNISPYLAFTEHFTNNNVYYDYSAKSEFVVQDKNRWQISGINTIQNVENIVSTPVFFLDVLSSDIDNYGDLTVTIEIDESGENRLSTINKQLDNLTEIVDNKNAKIPKLILYGKDPRSMIVPNGPISAATNDEITPFTNGIFDYQPGTLSTSDPYYDKTIAQPPLFRGGAHDLYFYGSLSGYGVREYIRYGQMWYSDPNRSYPYARKITKDTAALSPDKDFAACHYGGDKTLGELFDATYNQAGYTNRGIISFATIDGKVSSARLQSDGTLSPSEYGYLTPYAALISGPSTSATSQNVYSFTIPYETWRQYAFKGSFIKSSADNRPIFSDFTRISHGTLSSLNPFSGTWSQSYDDVNRPSYNPKRVLQNGSLTDVPPKFTLAIGFVNTSVTNVDIGNKNIATGSFGLSAGRNFRTTENSAANGVGSKMPYSIILSNKMSQPDPNLYPVRDDFISHSFVTTIKSIKAEVTKSSLSKRRYKGVYNKIAYFKYNNAVSVDGHAFGNFSFSPFPIGLSRSTSQQAPIPTLDVPGYAASTYYGQSYSSVFGIGKSSAPAHNMTMGGDGTFNKSTQILTSDSIIAFGDSSKIVANYYFDDDSDSLYYELPPTGAALGGKSFAGNTLLGGFDINEPNFLSLSIFSTPTKNNKFDASIEGIVKTSGDTTLAARGIDSLEGSATLWIGKNIMKTGETLKISGPNIENFTSLQIEEVAPTKKMFLSISTPFPTGMNLVIGQPLATGDTTLFTVGPIQNTGDTTLRVQGSALFAGQHTLATSGIGIKRGFMPIEIEGVFFKDGQMSLHAGNIKGSGDTTLQTRGHIALSGDLNPLSIKSIGSFNGSTTAQIGTRFDIKDNDMSLAIKDTERHLNTDTTLNIDGKITSISSLTHGEQNYTVARNKQLVDISPTSVELPVSLYYDGSSYASNSIVNRTIGESNGSSEIITNSSKEYFGAGSTAGGLFVPTRLVENPKVSVAEKTRISASNSSGNAFYSDGFDFDTPDEIIKREAYDANGKYFVVGNNDGSSGRSSINIYDIVDGSFVQFKSKLQLNLGEAIPDSLDDTGHASGGTTASPFGDSFVGLRRAIKDNFDSSFENADLDTDVSELVIYDLKISKLGQVAISTRVKISYGGTQEIIFNVIVLFNVSSVLEGSSTVRAGLPTYYTTNYKYSILQESDTGPSKHSSGYTIAFDGEDLYFDRRSGQWGQVWKLSQSNDYSQATQVIDYGSHPDALNYVTASNGIYISEENKKAAFGVPIKIYDDYNSTDKLMFVGAHLFDPYVFNTLSLPHTPNAIGAVYIYRRALNSTNWTYFGAVYGKGNTSSNINTNLSQYKDSSLANKQYGLFGYDFDYSEGNLVVSEPGGNGSESVNVGRAYLFEIGNSTITLSKTYLASDISLPSRDRDDHSNSSNGKKYSNIGKTSNFGSHIILLNGDNPITFSDTRFGNGVLHSLKSNDTIRSSTQYLKSSYTVGKWGATLNTAISNIRDEVSPYESPVISDYDSNLITTSYFVNSIKVLNFGENQKKIGIIRRFATRLKAPADASYEYNLDKLFLQDLRQEAFTLFISGPQVQNNSIDLAMPTIGRPSGDMSLMIRPSPVVNTGNMDLVMFNSTQFKTMPLHIETVRNNYIPISISGVGGTLSKDTSLQVTARPVLNAEQTLYMSGLGVPSASSTFVISGLEQANTVNFASLFIGKEINANDKMSLYAVSDVATEAGYSKYADINTISIDGTNASGINTQSTLSVKGPSFGTTTNSATVSISTPIPEIATDGFYLHSGVVPIAVSGSNASSTFIADESFTTLSVVASIQTTNTAPIYIQRPFANAASLFVKNLNPTGVVTTVVSGANIVSGVAPLFVKPNELFTTELFVRGYLE